MGKLKIDADEFDAILRPEEKENKKNTDKKEDLSVGVKISLRNKLALSDILRKKEAETGKFTALNRFIDEILTEYLKKSGF